MKTKFGKSLYMEMKREGRHIWRSFQCNSAAEKAISNANKANSFSVDGALDRAIKKSKRGLVSHVGNRRIS